ncbi:peptidoglycan DD-metalloendopeptidase family protein [Streptomyces sp. NPDC048629]|uniref:M23 family metallopeptidase n=1 Tax=Streptomyces sp. NPDC048629 TaxID=3154824 RepID=UPI003415791D
MTTTSWADLLARGLCVTVCATALAAAPGLPSAADDAPPRHALAPVAVLAGSLRSQAEAQLTAARNAAADEAERHRAEELLRRRAAEQAASRTAARPKPSRPAPAAWVRPVRSYVLGAAYGRSGSRWSHRHSGQDFVVPTGTRVAAVHDGVVVEAGWGGAYGNNIVIRHARGVYTQYGHLSSIRVSVGQRVSTGQIIGRSGSTGNSTGPHLHFEARTSPYYGSSVSPLAFLRWHGVQV